MGLHWGLRNSILHENETLKCTVSSTLQEQVEYLKLTYDKNQNICLYLMEGGN